MVLGGGNKNYAPPVYHVFIDEAIKIGQSVELIHPARFLNDAGGTPKEWNKKILNDPHFQVLEHIEKSSDIFPDTEIKGGLAITYYDNSKVFGAIGVFTKDEKSRTILQKVTYSDDFKEMSDIVFSRSTYRLIKEKVCEDYPKLLDKLGNGRTPVMSSNIFEKLPQIFLKEKPSHANVDYIIIMGREGNKRTSRYIRKDYVNEPLNLNSFKLMLPKATGSGAFGEVLSPSIVEPGTGFTETFISIGNFKSRDEANNCAKYIKTKFVRALLGISKVTQNLKPKNWIYVPKLDYSFNSYIDWNKTIEQIDTQLYRKYKLTPEEEEYIKKNVRESDKNVE